MTDPNRREFKSYSYDEEDNDESEFYITELSNRVNKLQVLSGDFSSDVKTNIDDIDAVGKTASGLNRDLGHTANQAGNLLQDNNIKC